MKAIRTSLTALLCAVAAATLLSCVERASEAEVDQMCQRLVALGGGGKAANEAAAITKCKQDAARERTFKSVADCRAKAADLDAFWNKCR